MKIFLRMIKNDSGAAAAEYALILAVVGSAIALSAIALGTAINTSIVHAKDCITRGTTGTTTGTCT